MSSNPAAAAKPRNPRTVVVISFILVLAFGVWGLVSPDSMTSVSVGLMNFVLESVGWFYLALCSGFIVLAAALALSPYGKIRLGPDDARPDFTTSSWIAMLFAGGMGAGLVFWGVAEPVTHFAHPPGDAQGQTAASARLAMVLTNLHWGLHAWSIYGVCALVLAYFIFRRGMPGMISTPMRATLPPSAATRNLGIVSDVIAVFAVVFGLAGSLVMGVLQVRAGVTEVFGLQPTTALSVFILALMAAAFMISTSSGLDKGMKLLSNLNMLLVMVLLAVVLVFGPTAYIMEAFVNGIGDYFSALPAYAFRLLSYENQMDWTNNWTLTYLIWWVAWGPFVGIFIARISRGRTIREFCLGVIVVPSIFSLFWFAALGSTGIWVELNGSGGLAALVTEDVAKALFAFLDYMPAGILLASMAIVLIFLFLVTSADSGTFVISMMTSEGTLNPKTALKLAWGATISLLTLAILLSGSVEVAKAMAAFGAVPFTVILVLQIVSFLRALREEPVGKRAQEQPA
ncbi:BCCT family transporter [uncultured Thiohalocapsa sp.]|uniref:BCCT family transporter n=1 Tax=uncultured Thiohalocapsa sp. TaxID=768990 RepID=UPI0025F4898B|nr:BCCT family transporter [uncultured Thiohalocapsa sp.]